MSTTAQKAQIKLALRRGERITQLYALSKFGCMRLSARIHELRQEGLPVTKDMVKRKGVCVAEYRLPN